MGRKKDRFWKHVEQENNGCFKCKYCERIFAGSGTRIKYHLAGAKGHDISICTEVPKDVQEEAFLTVGKPNKKLKGASTSNKDKEREISSTSMSKDDMLSGVFEKNQAEYMVEIFVEGLLAKLRSIVIEKNISFELGFKEGLTNLSSFLTQIQLVLKDVEQRQASDEFLRIWLVELRLVACDFVDVLDEFAYNILQQKMAQETQDANDKMWPPHIKQLFIDLMVDEQQKGNMEHGVFKPKAWLSITKILNEQTGKSFSPKQVEDKHNRLRQKQRKWGQLLRHTGLGWDETTQTVTASDEVWANVIAVDNKAAALRKKGCPNYDKLKQLFAPNTATGSLQISSNTPAPDSDEERVLEEELANEARQTQLDDDDCYNPNMEGITQNDPTVDEQTQRADKRPMEELTTKGKKVAKKNDRASEMTMPLQECTALVREMFYNKKGKSRGSSDHVAQFAGGKDPCSLERALEVLNQYNDLDDDTYFNIAEALRKKEKRVLFMGMPEHRRRRWMERHA